MLFARLAVETCMYGMYWLGGHEDIEQIRRYNAKSAQRLLRYLVTGGVFPAGLIEDVVTQIGAPAVAPDVRKMAETVANSTEDTVATDLYDRLYVPLSTFSVHATGDALLRHVRAASRLSDKPSRVWTMRSAMHTVDACVGILATAIAKHGQRSAEPFARYANAHMSRTTAPLAVVGFDNGLRGLRWSKVPRAVRALLKLRRYLGSDAARRDTLAERETHAKRGFTECLQVLGDRSDRSYFEPIVNQFAEMLARSVTPNDMAPGVTDE